MNLENTNENLRKLCTTHSFVCLVPCQFEKIQNLKQAALDLKLSVKKTRKREFLEQMERVVPWAQLVALIALYYPVKAEQGARPLPWRRCYAFTFSSNDAACRTCRWRKLSLTCRCTASLPGSTSLSVCPMRAPFFGFATGWRQQTGRWHPGDSQ